MAQLTQRQQRLVFFLLAGLPVSKAASRAGVSQRTAFRWTKEPSFRAALSAAARQAYDEALRTLRGSAREAVAELIRLRRKAKNEGVRLRAALAPFDVISRCDLDDVLRRLENLEAQREDEST
jgi:transposase